MSTPVIGIDLGTTNSVVSYTDGAGVTHVIADENGDRIVPSVVQFGSDGGIVVGKNAKAYAKVEPERVASVFKRGMGESTFLPDGREFVVDSVAYSPEQLSAMVLKKLADIAARELGAPTRRAIITVPHYFGEPERAATRSAGEIAGLEVVQIINEPTAAAIARGADGDSDTSGRLLVFDLGGGTFDVTVMEYGAGREMTVIASDGDRELGGADFDRKIVERMQEVARAERDIELEDDPWMLADAYAQAEEVKKELSTNESSRRPLSVGGRPLMFELSRAEFEELIADEIQFADDAVRNALDKVKGAPPSQVLMVGGSSRIPRFRELVHEITGIAPEFTKNLDEDVSRGAAMLGAKLDGGLDPRSELAKMPIPQDAASHAVGIQLVREAANGALQEYNSVIIPEGTPVPHTAAYDFGAASDGQTMVEVVLFEGSDENITFCRELGKSEGSFGRPVPRGYPLRCQVEYTVDQLVVVNLHDGQTNAHIVELKVVHEGLLSDDERAAARDRLAGLSVR
ncbi:MAG TPA: Hsp70 family protein [Solirubrobacteraceae bacterium]|jgi:molecular chaperone DnaK|nr:Hsp70 family protein [Solirubrobacteraceae bacterium]